MSAALLGVIVTVLGVVLAALVTGAVTLGVALYRWHRDNHRLWQWNRALMDHIYRGQPPPPPPAPHGLFE